MNPDTLSIKAKIAPLGLSDGISNDLCSTTTHLHVVMEKNPYFCMI